MSATRPRWSPLSATASVAVALLSSSALACSSARYGTAETGHPTWTLPAHFAEGSGEGADGGAPATPASPGGAPAAASAHPVEDGRPPAWVRTAPPDPEPLVTATQWELELRYERGRVVVDRVRSVTLPKPVATPRLVGRFAVELWIGHELVDRVRFDFPLLAADAPPPGARHALHETPRFSPGAETARTVQIPDSDRATRAVIVDRLTGDTVPLEWPPIAPAPAPEPGGAAP